MPLQIINEGRGFRLLYQGQWSHDEFAAGMRSVTADSEFDRCRFVIHDLNAAAGPMSEVSASVDAIATSLLTALRPRRVVHALVTRDQGNAVAYAAAFEVAGVDLEVFPSYHDASVWADASTGFSDLMDSMFMGGSQ